MSGSALIRTETGSVYQFDPAAMTVTRMIVGKDSQKLRRDGDPLKVRGISELRVGYPVIFRLEPLGEGDITIRTTSRVVSLVKVGF